MTTTIAIIGDRFMLPDVFARRRWRPVVRRASSCARWSCPGRTSRWCTAMPTAALAGLKEYHGRPGGDGPSSSAGRRSWSPTWRRSPAAMLDRLPRLKLIAVSRGGPVNIDIEAARDRGVPVVNTPGRNASAVAEFTIGAILAETRLIRAGHEALRQGDWRGDLYRADLTGDELSRADRRPDRLRPDRHHGWCGC